MRMKDKRIFLDKTNLISWWSKVSPCYGCIVINSFIPCTTTTPHPPSTVTRVLLLFSQDVFLLGACQGQLQVYRDPSTEGSMGDPYRWPRGEATLHRWHEPLKQQSSPLECTKCRGFCRYQNGQSKFWLAQIGNNNFEHPHNCNHP